MGIHGANDYYMSRFKPTGRLRHIPTLCSTGFLGILWHRVRMVGILKQLDLLALPNQSLRVYELLWGHHLKGKDISNQQTENDDHSDENDCWFRSIVSGTMLGTFHLFSLNPHKHPAKAESIPHSADKDPLAQRRWVTFPRLSSY